MPTRLSHRVTGPPGFWHRAANDILGVDAADGMAWTASGEVWTFELPYGSDQQKPHCLPRYLERLDFPAVERADRAPGGGRICGVLASGGVHCRGDVVEIASLKRTSRVDVAQVVQTGVPGFEDAAEVALGVSHICARTASGRVLCAWGDDQLQIGVPADPRPVAFRAEPARVLGLP